MNPRQQQSLIKTIQEARAPIAASTLGMTVFSSPDILKIIFPEGLGANVFPTAQCPTLNLDINGRISNPGYYELQTAPSLEYIKSNPRSSLIFLSLSIRAALLNVGDELKKIDYLDKSPELEFLRHIRNGVAHGNRFHFLGPVKKAASFRTYTITDSLQGTKIFSDHEGDGFLHIGDALALLDFLESKITSAI